MVTSDVVAPAGEGGEWSEGEAVREPRPAVESFAEAGLAPALVRALGARGIHEPFAIQAAVLPDALEGEHILARAQTGSGKTLGFGLPLLTELAHLRDAYGRPHRHEPRGLVLVPTRELAHQVNRELEPLAESLDLSTVVVTGGAPYRPQQDALRRRVDLVIATPGRLIDLVNRGDADLEGIAITVLDEADHMAELGFLEDMIEILGSVPADGQRMLFSATLDRGVDVLVREYLPSPVLVAIDPAASPVETASHHVFHVPDWRRKRPLVAALANGSGRTLVFVRTQLGADRVAEELAESGIQALPLHGGMSQGARSRALRDFMDGYVRVLVATDVAARGIHVDDIDVVVQADPTSDAKTYLHRSGRTARAGNGGVVVTVVMPREKRSFERLLKDANVMASVTTSKEDEPDVEVLVGPPAPPPPPKPTRNDRGPKGKHAPRGQRADGKPRHGDRRESPRRRDDDNRGGYRDRDESPRRDDRDSYRGRDDRGGYRDRGERPRRDDRGSYRPRDDRGGFRDRDERPRRDDRDSYRGRDDRGSYRAREGSNAGRTRSDDRYAKSSGPRAERDQSREWQQRPPRDREERRDDRGSDPRHPGSSRPGSPKHAKGGKPGKPGKPSSGKKNNDRHSGSKKPKHRH